MKKRTRKTTARKSAKRKTNPMSALPVGRAISGVLKIVRRKNGRKVVTFRASK